MTINLKLNIGVETGTIAGALLILLNDLKEVKKRFPDIQFEEIAGLDRQIEVVQRLHDDIEKQIADLIDQASSSSSMAV